MTVSPSCRQPYTEIGVTVSISLEETYLPRRVVVTFGFRRQPVADNYLDYLTFGDQRRRRIFVF